MVHTKKVTMIHSKNGECVDFNSRLRCGASDECQLIGASTKFCDREPNRLPGEAE
jgi:hypothetical protein